ncbi:MAG TPA: hypothetical protein VEF89_15305 [Solirubrobacteraceae bacterium]|nr:hypothetical protein [Solirubrobacteraceae bacterium]
MAEPLVDLRGLLRGLHEQQVDPGELREWIGRPFADVVEPRPA